MKVVWFDVTRLKKTDSDFSLSSYYILRELIFISICNAVGELNSLPMY